jgi:peptidoglycan hydrolase-like protein with peptidoglycan-binding domain
MSATGLAAARLIQSPSELAARSAAPAPLIMTAVARMRVLSDAIVLPGTVRPGHTVAVTASAPYRTLVVTGLPAKLGSRAWPGHVLAQVDGRPVILLRGRLPAYRDLREGDTGPDVSQLQAALVGLGYADYDPAGYFGPSTALAIETLYQNLGYSAPRYRPHVKKTPLAPGQPPPLPPSPQVYLPMSEVSYIPAASALVVDVNARPGSSVRPGQVMLELATGDPYVTAMLSVREAAEASKGSAARIASASPALSDPGVVAKISPIPAYASKVEYPVDVTTRARLPQTMIGRTVRLTLWSSVTSEPVLTVPITAVFLTTPAKAKGNISQKATRSRPVKPVPYVTVIAARGRSRRIAVATGPSASGFVAIQPLKPGSIEPGAHVLIGTGR